MNYFEQELRKLFDKGQAFENPSFVGRACLGTLGKDLRVRVEFDTNGYVDHYDTLKISVLNRTGGSVDTLAISLKELLGMKAVPGNPYFSDGVEPHIWEDRGTAEWYAFHPASADYQAMRQAVGQYLDNFRDRQVERVPGGPRLVYICALLRGDVEQNIAFARNKAQEVFASGDIPICPHLMFPSIADPGDPAQDEAVREMGLRLVGTCQQINVYGPIWTDGMWAEIDRASQMGIPMMTDQKTLGKFPAQRHCKNSGRGTKGHER